MDAEIEAMKMILDVDNGFVLSTESMRKSEYSRTKKPIIKPEKIGWSIRLLSAFINELTDWIPDTNNDGRKRSRLKSSSYNIFKYFSKENEIFFIIIHINADQINVKSSKDWIDSWINNEEEIKESWVKYKVFIKFSLSASKAIYRNSSLLFYPEDEFSPTFRHFARSFIDKKIADLSEDTSPIFYYYDSFICHAIYENISIEDLIKTTEGYLYLELNTSNNTGKKLDICHIDSKPYFILSGTYFSPFILNLVQDNLVNGIQLDTTWSVLQQYVTSIPTV